jgi:hypothetical protein
LTVDSKRVGICPGVRFQLESRVGKEGKRQSHRRLIFLYVVAVFQLCMACLVNAPAACRCLQLLPVDEHADSDAARKRAPLVERVRIRQEPARSWPMLKPSAQSPAAQIKMHTPPPELVRSLSLLSDVACILQPWFPRRPGAADRQARPLPGDCASTAFQSLCWCPHCSSSRPSPPVSQNRQGYAPRS